MAKIQFTQKTAEDEKREAQAAEALAQKSENIRATAGVGQADFVEEESAKPAKKGKPAKGKKA
ncbi:MAG: hypothetical protein JWL62_204 [Hyphomicrobiales bacterium]|nr:hypothetical protein [Hyphomicrobiales bacterium]